MGLEPVRKLLVEGDEDKRVIPELIEKATGLPWQSGRGRYLVEIVSAGGIKNLLQPDYLATELKTARLHSLGIILDADDDPAAQWQSLRDRCLPFCPTFPSVPDPLGMIVELSAPSVRLGVWLMPDNQQRGMLETFLLALRPAESSPQLWAHAVAAVSESTRLGATFRQHHHDKALCHTFLAWQDPPGRQLHQALQEKLLDASAPPGKRFVDWFRRLYGV